MKIFRLRLTQFQNCSAFPSPPPPLAELEGGSPEFSCSQSFLCSALDDVTLLMGSLGSSFVSPAKMPAFLGPDLFLASSLWIPQNPALYPAHSSDHFVRLQAVCATMQSSPSHCLTAVALHFYTDLIIAIPPNCPLPSWAFP